MKRLIIVVLILFISAKGKSTTIPLDSIKTSVISFLKEVEKVDHSIESLGFLLVDTKTKKPIEEGKDGIYFFNMLGTRSYTHFLLVDKDSFRIINMKDPLDQNILKLIDFFEKNNRYKPKDVLFYIKDIVNRYQRDKESIRAQLYPKEKNNDN